MIAAPRRYLSPTDGSGSSNGPFKADLLRSDVVPATKWAAKINAWLDEGKISFMAFHSKFDGLSRYNPLDKAEFQQKLANNNQYGSRLAMTSRSTDYFDYLSTDIKSSLSSMTWHNYPYAYSRVSDFYRMLESKKGKSAIPPNTDRISPSVMVFLKYGAISSEWKETVKEEKRRFIGTKKVKEKVKEITYGFDDNEVRVVINTVSSRIDSFKRPGIMWQMKLICKNEVAEEIFNAASKSHEALFGFFVENVSGFAELEGNDYQKYVEKIQALYSHPPGDRALVTDFRAFNELSIKGEAVDFFKAKKFIERY